MLNQPKEFNLIAMEHPVVKRVVTIQSIISTFDKPTSKRPNIVIWGGNLNNEGARLLQQAFTISSIHLGQYYDGGACIPFGLEGHFNCGFAEIARRLPNDFMNYIYPSKNVRLFSTERWSSNNSNYKAKLLPNNAFFEFIKATWNFIRYTLTRRYLPQASYAFHANWINFAATEAGEAICNKMAKDCAQSFQNIPELSLLLNDESKPSFARLLQSSELAKELLQNKKYSLRELKALANLFVPQQPYPATPADKFFAEKRAQLNKVIGQHTPREVPVPPVAPELPQVVIDMPANNAFVQNFDRQQAPVENANVAPAAAVVSVEPPKL